MSNINSKPDDHAMRRGSARLRDKEKVDYVRLANGTNSPHTVSTHNPEIDQLDGMGESQITDSSGMKNNKLQVG